VLEALGSAFDMVEVENISQARQALSERGGGVFLGSPADAEASGLSDGSTVLSHLGEGVGVVDATGTFVWADPRLEAADEQTQKSFVEYSLQALELFNQTGASGRRSRRFGINSESTHLELVVSPASVDGDRVTSVAGVLWDVTSGRQLQAKVDAIDAAGAELMKIEASSIAQMNMAQRLKLLERKIVHFVNDLLNFDNFEIRLLDRETGQLELVIAIGLSPLKIGEVIYAEPEGNGISGYVAATGRSYICADVQRDSLYREGLDNAASSLTVPLRLHDHVIGVFNIESYTPNAFNENDRKFAEIFGRYIAMATNILDLLVVERYTTNEQVTENFLGELSEPLSDITAEVIAMEAEEVPEPITQAIERIKAAAASIRSRIEDCAAGPRSILGADQELKKHEIDPVMLGQRVLVADNERTIRETLQRILSQRGCDVTICHDGVETMAALEAASKNGRPYRLVLSDIKMPDRNGYEVFRKAKSVAPDTTVILMTGFGYDPHHSIVRASQEGLDSFLFKPFKATQMIDAVTSALKRDADGNNASG
jgi:CheY-like chemotaxis protein